MRASSCPIPTPSRSRSRCSASRWSCTTTAACSVIRRPGLAPWLRSSRCSLATPRPPSRCAQFPARKGIAMPFSAALPQISTNVRFAASRLLFPELAGSLAERLFLTPPRSRDAAAAALDLIDARSSIVEHKGRSIVTWRWGSRDAPAVLLAHGWGGHAAQMRSFVFPLLSAGFRVIAYDQPAHGVSEGKLTGLPDFADVLAEVAWHHGEVEGVIGHSLGGGGALIAMARGLRVRRVVTIGTSLDFSFFTREFARWHWIPRRVLDSMQA